MGQSSDAIREEIDHYRQDATDKINQLEGQVQGTAEDLRSEAVSAASDVREQVNATVSDTVESVKENVNIEQMVRDRPLVSLGAALIAGFVAGGVIGGGDDRSGARSSTSSSSGFEPRSGSAGGGMGDTLRDMFRKSGLEETVSNATAALVGSVTDQFKQVVDQNVQGFSQKMEEAKHTQGSTLDKTRQTQP